MWLMVREMIISAAHYYQGYHSKQSSVHGHDFVVQVCFSGESLGETGVCVEERDLDKLMGRVVGEFEHQLINKVEPFDKMNPTPELLGQYIYEGIVEHLEQSHPKGVNLAVQWVSVKAGYHGAVIRYMPSSVQVFS